jgi:hypothetical protein
MVVMIRVEDERLLKLKGTSVHAHNSTYLSHHDEGTLPSSLLWQAGFGHINYDNLRLLKKNGVFGLPTIPRKLKQCDACTLGKHNKRPFHDSTSRAHRKLELIHFDLCGPMPVPSAFGNRYIVTFIDDYTRMCWVCYPRYLGITRRSCLEAHMVLDMEYREQERPEHGPGGPIFFFSASFVLPAVPASITTRLGLASKKALAP